MVYLKKTPVLPVEQVYKSSFLKKKNEPLQTRTADSRLKRAVLYHLS